MMLSSLNKVYNDFVNFRHNYFVLRVYFEEMNYELIEEEPDYTWQQLIGECCCLILSD